MVKKAFEEPARMAHDDAGNNVLKASLSPKWIGQPVSFFTDILIFYNFILFFFWSLVWSVALDSCS